MEQDTFYELTRRAIPLSKNTGVHLSWHDSVMSVLTEKGMNFLDFSYNLECFDKEISIFEHSIASPKSSPAESLCKSKFINSEMKNYDYTEMIIDSSFWPHNDSLTQEMTNLIMSAWSPSNFIENNSVLAVLNNIGGVEILIQQQYKWKTVLNLSPYTEKYLAHNASPKTFEELKKSVYIVTTCCICWAPKLNPDSSCYFVTAQRNGYLLFWQISNNQEPIVKAKIQSCMSEIKNMLWVSIKETTFWLICADLLGQVNLLDIQNTNGDVTLTRTQILWEHKDRMIASHLQYLVDKDKIILFYSKHRHFVVQVLDKTDCALLKQYVNNINDYRITDITNSVSGYYLCTINAKIFKLNIRYLESLSIELIPVPLKDAYSTYELYSVCFSNTNTLCVLGMLDRKLLCRKESLKIDIIFLSTESKLNSVMQSLLENPTKKLTNYWDCVETLRYKIIKTRQIPALDYEALYTEGSNDAYKLKIYLVILIIYLNMRNTALIPSDVTLPQTSVNAVKEKLLLLQAQSNMQKLYKEYLKNGDLNIFEKESLFGCLNYFKYYSKTYKTQLSIEEDILKLGSQAKFEYICQSCDCNVSEGFMCQDEHLNMYCMLSFTPIINDDYLVCKCCDSTARADLQIDHPLCVFCDQRLVKSA